MCQKYFNPRAPCGARHLKQSEIAAILNFNPRAPCGARRAMFFGRWSSLRFQSTRPMRGATGQAHPLHPLRLHFNPRAPCGARLWCDTFYSVFLIFQSTRPMRGATHPNWIKGGVSGISIHAPHAGRDLIGADGEIDLSISIHAPHAGRDEHLEQLLPPSWQFQSTRPMRGATCDCRQRYFFRNYFNPRAPCGARPRSGVAGFGAWWISIHAPHAGRDEAP